MKARIQNRKFRSDRATVALEKYRGVHVPTEVEMLVSSVVFYVRGTYTYYIYILHM
jgi:hypothetical protein